MNFLFAERILEHLSYKDHMVKAGFCAKVFLQRVSLKEWVRILWYAYQLLLREELRISG